MAWITKNSAEMKVERRAEPYLTPAMRKEITEKYLAALRASRGRSSLRCTWCSTSTGGSPARRCSRLPSSSNSSHLEVIDTASFYEEYWLKPKGQHLVQVCRSIAACEFCGQKEITQACKDKLGIDVGETTDDGKFTLIELECLGSCGSA